MSSDPPRSEESSSGQPPVVLLVDDDEDFVRVFSNGLRRADLKVISATSAQEAHEIASSLDRLDVLVADINLKDGWGSTLALTIRQIHPAAEVIYVSGYAVSDPVLREGIEDHMAFLGKPFGVSELVEAIRRALD